MATILAENATARTPIGVAGGFLKHHSIMFFVTIRIFNTALSAQAFLKLLLR